MKSKPAPETQSNVQDKSKNVRLMRILDKLRQTAAPTLEELADEAKYAVPDPLIDNLMSREKKNKFKYF